jgi:hypothetical protein
MSRPTLTPLLAALALLAVAAPVGAAGAPAKRTACQKATALAKKKSRSKAQARARARAKTRACAKARPKMVDKPASTTVPAVPVPPTGSSVTVTVDPGSDVTLDLGNGRVRTFPLEGVFRGFMVGVYRPGQEADLQLTRGQLAVGPTDTLTDDCPAPALARTDPATIVTLDPGRPSPLVIGPDGAVAFKVNAIIRVVLDLRLTNPCGGATATSGYADTAGTIPLGGRLDPAAPGTPFAAESHLFPLRLRACYIPGDADQPCPFPPTGLLAVASVHLQVSVDFGS